MEHDEVALLLLLLEQRHVYLVERGDVGVVADGCVGLTDWGSRVSLIWKGEE